jgi:hypothetical protein
MADNLVYEESLNTEIETSEFISKKWVYVNDNNNANYTSQIVIDSTPLSNAGGYISWQEGFILMPLLIQLTSSTAGTLPVGTPKGNYSWAIKSGFWHLINSMTVEFNNQNVIQQTPFLNVFRSFKANTSYSLDDLLNVGPTTGFYPDSANSWFYSDDTTANPTTSQSSADCANNSLTNNRDCAFQAQASAIPAGFVATASTVAPPLFTTLPANGIAGAPTLSDIGGANSGITYDGASVNSVLTGGPNSVNEGMVKRQTWYNYNPLSANGQGTINGSVGCRAVLRSFCDEGLNGTAGSLCWQVYAKLRLKDLADFFEKMPLLKGSTIRFYLNTNQSIVNFTALKPQITKASGVLAVSGALTINSVNVVGGLTCPLMVASNRIGSGLNPLSNPDVAVNTQTFNLSVSIVRNNFSAQAGANTKQTTLTACRLYAPVYYMNPLAESKYLSLAPTKKIMYKDVFQYQFNGQSNGVFNFLVSNGISNIQSVLVVPFLSKNNLMTTSVGAGQVQANLSYQNPCSASPAMPDPIMISDFNILVSGVNLFLNNEVYDFEAFIEQLAQSNQINGGLTTGLASGLINESAFSSGYRYYYGDCSRILPSEQGVSRSVQIVGNNVSTAIIDIMVFVEFMREITIDISTGARIE